MRFYYVKNFTKIYSNLVSSQQRDPTELGQPSPAEAHSLEDGPVPKAGPRQPAAAPGNSGEHSPRLKSK